MHEKSGGKNYENKELQSRGNGSETGESVSGIALSLSPTWTAVGDGATTGGVFGYIRATRGKLSRVRG